MEKENSTPKEEFKFFSRAKKAIFNLEKYSDFAKEKLTIAIKYIIFLTIILAAVEIVIYSVQANKLLNKVEEYIENELPVYTYEKPELNAENAKTAYDEEYDFYFAIDTKSEDAIDEYREEMKKHSIGLILTREDALVYSAGEEYSYTYAALTEGFAVEMFNSKTNLLKSIQENKASIVIYGAIVVFVSYIINYLLLYVTQLLAIALMIYITGKVIGVEINYKESFIIAAYSTTLSTLLTVIYALTSAFTSFKIVNFDLMYNIIIYIYGVCAVIMLKIDDVKQKEEIAKELKKVEEVQIEVHKELEETKKATEKSEEKKEEIVEELKETSEEVIEKISVEDEKETTENSEETNNETKDEKVSSKKSKAKKSKKEDA